MLSTLVLALSPLAASAPQTPEIPADTEIITTESGLKYSVLQAGNGAEFPKMGDRVKVHYTGWLTDGTLFDSSRQRGTPSEFALGEVIQGWNEGLQKMSPGARHKLTIPFDLAYGEAGRPPQIPAKATLIFDVELIAITARVPEYTAMDAAKTETLESGLKVQWVENAEGPACGPESTVWVDFALWDQEGTCVFATSMRPTPNIIGVQQAPFPFMKEALGMMGPGDSALFEVPPALAFGDRQVGTLAPNSTTVWRVQVRKIFDKPAFSLPADEELTTTESGLRYKVLSPGEGDAPAATNQVQVHYAGWLTDGTPFDSSYDRGQAATFPLNGVIKGWTEGLQLIKPGGSAILVIPSDLGYGERGSPPKIPGGAELVFHVELIQVL